jgi:hypothetical protein
VKYLWQLYYWLFPRKNQSKLAVILEFCRKNDVMWQEVTYDRSRWNKDEFNYW